ncbi:MAG: hypothetical protein RQ751_13425 [Longimicrobiales bacterium]|nr:hypothetical protein [Longimicrobiales bacterium]
MEHLSLEALARLVDETPAPAERRHLSECGRCRTELELLQGQTRALGQLPDLVPPRGEWTVLEARLMSEGLLRHERSLLAATPGWMKAAAVVLLFLSGTGLGAVLGAGGPGAVAMRTAPGAVPGAGTVVQASDGPASLEEAREAVRLAERRYMDALVRYRQLVQDDGGAAQGNAPETRLAALEYLVAAGRAAVEQAPADPFLNGFLTSALAERQVTYQAALARTGGSADWY